MGKTYYSSRLKNALIMWLFTVINVRQSLIEFWTPAFVVLEYFFFKFLST